MTWWAAAQLAATSKAAHKEDDFLQSNEDGLLSEDNFLEAKTNINIFLNNEINGVYISNTYSKQIKIL